MRHRPLGRSGIDISEIGFGAWGIGGSTPGATSYGKTDDATSLRALGAALDHGITFFDTSGVYGYGHSEELLGLAFTGQRDRVVIGTKAGLREYGSQLDFSPASIRASVEGSLRRLRTDYVDLLQWHNPSAERMETDEDEIRATAERLKYDGLIRAFGISIRAPQDGFVAIRKLQPDALQTNFNLLDQRALDCGLLDAAASAGCAVIARTPLCFGFLAGHIDEATRFAPDDHRSRWPREQIEWWARGGRLMREHAASERGQTPGQFALRFCLSLVGITSAIPGMLGPGEVIENAAAGALGPLDDDVIAAVRATYRGLGQPAAKPADPGRIDRVSASQAP
jgi:aryl-alcohol dehydrogenase-like predicted oxidoreductase